MAILEIKALSFTYPGAASPTLSDINIEIERGSFCAVCGATGSGKSTLLRMLKRELRPLGDISGEVRYNGAALDSLDGKTSACSIGFVMQRPEQQLVTDKVWHELAFGLENAGIPSDEIRRRTAEMACYFGIEEWFDKSVAELSGGQKQLLNLAAVMVMQPQVLILDEPTAQLDPIAASDFITTLKKLNTELALTVIIVEHRLEDVIPVSDKLIALDAGKIAAYGDTRETAVRLKSIPALLEGMPAALRLYCRFENGGKCPLTVREGHDFIERGFKNDIRTLKADTIAAPAKNVGAALEFKDVYFRYSRDGADILRGLNLRVNEGEIYAVLGGNGSGKSTTLGAAAGINRIYAGEIRVFGKKLRDYKGQSLYSGCVALLPQDVQTVFLKNTVREELSDSGADISALPYDLTPCLDSHPYDLSGGQQQLCALAKVLAAKPRLLLLDEPTKGIDAHGKNEICRILRSLAAGGMTIIAVTHDVEFAAASADRCAMFFRGEIVSCAPPREFFSDSSFYTTAAARMTRGIYDGVVSVSDAENLCRINGERGRREGGTRLYGIRCHEKKPGKKL